MKILDYLGAGLPIVTTKKGIEGIDATEGRDAIIVDEVKEKFIEAIIFLINNEEQCRTLGKNGRKLAEERYDWEKIGESLNTYYHHIIADSNPTSSEGNS